MFSELHSSISRRQVRLQGVSLALHFLFLGWILLPPTPVFVAPSAVARGDEGSSVTPIYFGGETGIMQEHPAARLTWQRPPKAKKVAARLHPMKPPSAKMEVGNEVSASLSPNDRSAGSLYGSLAYGSLTGPEVRPALPVVSPDPVFGSDLGASTAGDVIIEITIDAQGDIIQSVVIQSLGPAIDQKVLAALSQWHFTPASRNGVPIASKQDVHYHFPR
jgi:TonB family protein